MQSIKICPNNELKYILLEFSTILEIVLLSGDPILSNYQLDNCGIESDIALLDDKIFVGFC